MYKRQLRDLRAALADGEEVVTFARPYTPDLVGLLRDLGQSTAAYDANGHYARVQPVFNAFETGPGGVLAPRTSSAPVDERTASLRLAR